MALPKHVVDRVSWMPLPRGRLLDIAELITMDAPNNGNAANDLRWLNGITWQPEPCQGLNTMDVDVCTRIDFLAVPSVCPPAISNTAFSVYDAFKGAAIEFEPSEIAALLEDRVTLKQSAAFASELLSGAASGDMALSKSAHAPTQRAFASAATPIWYVLTVLEDELARTLRGIKGMLHIPPGLLAQAKVTYGLVLNAAGEWETPLGNAVVADAGYVDSAAPTGQAASPIGTDWVYASGPVRYRKSAIHFVDDGNIGSTMTSFTSTETAAQSQFRSRDDMVRWIDSFGIFQFNPCPVTAALASYEQTDIV